MKKKLFILLMCLAVFCGCGKQKEEQECDTSDGCAADINIETDGMSFKEAYESLNGTVNASGKEHRTVTIAEDNPFVSVSAEEAVQKIEDGESFYVYVGDEKCPWCRSVIEKAIEIAKEASVSKILYLKIWDDEGNEVLRDKYVYEDGSLKEEVHAPEAYYSLLESWHDYLRDYTLDNDGETIDVGEKRIYAPNFIHVVDGKIVSLVRGVSEKQEDSREELSEEMLNDEEDIFREFFK